MREHRVTSSPRNTRIARAVALCTSALVTSVLATSAFAADTPSSADQRLMKAMQRDLGLDARQAERYLQTERSATARLPKAKQRLGAAYAGSWIEQGKDGRFRFVVAATSTDGVAKARALGVEARLAKRSLAQLDSAKGQLDRHGRQRRPSAGIHGWYVDERTNQIVVETDGRARDAAIDFIARSGIDAAAVRFETAQAAPRPTQIVGGERYWTPSAGCSIAFPVTKGADTGFATAGHCAPVGTQTYGADGVTAQGVFAGSSFPGSDMGWVRITNTPAWPLRNWVNNYAGGAVPISGGTEAPVGAAVCRSGATTGYRCGTITAKNVTVNYPQGATYGLNRSSACVGFGDSGGAYITPAGQAQGVTSGGNIPSGSNDNCGLSSPVSYYQPLQPLLGQYGLTLYTGAGTGLPVINYLVCPDLANSGGGMYVCYATYSSATPVTVNWTGGNGSGNDYNGYTEFVGYCTAGQMQQLTVTITNSSGAVVRSSGSFGCPTGPIP